WPSGVNATAGRKPALYRGRSAPRRNTAPGGSGSAAQAVTPDRSARTAAEDGRMTPAPHARLTPSASSGGRTAGARSAMLRWMRRISTTATARPTSPAPHSANSAQRLRDPASASAATPASGTAAASARYGHSDRSSRSRSDQSASVAAPGRSSAGYSAPVPSAAPKKNGYAAAISPQTDSD